MIIDINIVADVVKLKRLIEEMNIGFFDFGCSQGQGIIRTESMTNTHGLGFDIDSRKLALADAKGVVCCGFGFVDGGYPNFQ